MNVSQFVSKWRRSTLKERSGSQEHFIDLCRVFDHPTPSEMDGVGDTFTFEREIAKANGRRGRADVWKRDFFALEYKSQGKELDQAHEQLRQYRESLLNPPLLAACDMRILDIRTNFTRKATKRYAVELLDLGNTENRRIVERLFYDPDKLSPDEDVEVITDKAAAGLAKIAQDMRARGLDPHQVAMFLDRVVFCLFAQSVRLLDGQVFTKIIEKTHRDPRWVSREIFKLFETMNTGGECALEKIRYFNGDLFANVQPLELTSFEVEAIHRVSRLNWAEVDASIFGTLFERGMDPKKLAEVGRHYTSRTDIATLIEPVVLSPLRREWETARIELDGWLDKGEARSRKKVLAKKTNQDSLWLRKARSIVHEFLLRLKQVTILDPACGSGNFLYVALQKLKDLEKEVLVYASERNIDGFYPKVGPAQLRGIEKSPYAYDLARVTIWIGWLQWTRANGYQVDKEPILSSLDNLLNEDAILDLSRPEEPMEPVWPSAEFIIGNPPFLGGKRLRHGLGDEYIDALFRLWKGRVRPESDLCCYWFDKARRLIADGKSKRAGLIATQAIRGGANRECLKNIKESGEIFFGISDQEWILNGAAVHVSMVGFDGGVEASRFLNGQSVGRINSDLTASEADLTSSRRLSRNLSMAFMGDTKGGKFEITGPEARALLEAPNPHGRPNSDVIVPWMNGLDLARRNRDMWIIDFGLDRSETMASFYEAPYSKVGHLVKPMRANNKREVYRERWWCHVEPRPALRRATGKLDRFLCTTTVSKHRLFSWVASPTLPDHQLIVFSRDDDYFSGILRSRVHEVWARSRGTQVRERESGFRYTPTTCFETFPLPEPFENLKAVIAEAARSFDDSIEAWLNPPEWTRTEVLEFPATIEGPWGRLVRAPDENGIGIVRHGRLVPKDSKSSDLLAQRTLTNLYNQRPSWFELSRRALDEAVLAAYGWKPDVTDYEILSRLLALNLEESKAVDVHQDPPANDAPAIRVSEASNL
ncbi:class I SAM-dependent DNA methyltransferase [Singulisphaera sp. PoT]|uniref:class I SAM-dependent DNA methyltransferase n=1 Tax=Singulisphaera sp. PoT TaxID=3411797 RepID=UPI003BF5273A